MRCLVTAGPTFEPLDEVRRFTNFSTGRLGLGLAAFLTRRGCDVHLLLSETATASPVPGEVGAIERFTTGADLAERLSRGSARPVGAVFHAAAVADFCVGQVAELGPKGELKSVQSRKHTTRQGALWVQLVPTPKILARLRTWFPQAKLIGWKYEVEGNREQAVGRGRDQLRENATDACVVNGPACGPGYIVLDVDGHSPHCATSAELYERLARLCGIG